MHSSRGFDDVRRLHVSLTAEPSVTFGPRGPSGSPGFCRGVRGALRATRAWSSFYSQIDGRASRASAARQRWRPGHVRALPAGSTRCQTAPRLQRTCGTGGRRSKLLGALGRAPLRRGRGHSARNVFTGHRGSAGGPGRLRREGLHGRDLPGSVPRSGLAVTRPPLRAAHLWNRCGAARRALRRRR